MMNLANAYPTQLIDVFEQVAGARITIRPFLPQDFEMQKAFFATLSMESRYMRFMTPCSDDSEHALRHMSQVDHRTHCLLIATVVVDGDETMIAEARIVATDNHSDVCEFAISVSELWRGYGLGARLLAGLEQQAMSVGYSRMVGDAISHNRSMLELAKRAGFATSRNPEDLKVARMTKVLAAHGHAWSAAPPSVCSGISRIERHAVA